jgi:transposase-like protein
MTENSDTNGNGSQRKPRRTVKPRKFKDEEKAAALVRLAENSTLDAPIAVTARELEINEKTLFAWSTGRGVAKHVLKLVEEKKETVADLYEEISVLAKVRLVEKLADERASITIPARDLVIIAGTATDKSRLLREKPTAITESRGDDAMKAAAERAIALIRERLECDTEAAFDYLQRQKPELARYVQ